MRNPPWHLHLSLQIPLFCAQTRGSYDAKSGQKGLWVVMRKHRKTTLDHMRSVQNPYCLITGDYTTHVYGGWWQSMNWEFLWTTAHMDVACGLVRATPLQLSFRCHIPRPWGWEIRVLITRVEELTLNCCWVTRVIARAVRCVKSIDFI